MATPAKALRVEIRVSEEERSLEEEAAAVLGQSLSEFIRQAARGHAEEVLAEHTKVVLGEDDAQRFLDALDNPGRSVDGLRRLTERPNPLQD